MSFVVLNTFSLNLDVFPVWPVPTGRQVTKPRKQLLNSLARSEPLPYSGSDINPFPAPELSLFLKLVFLILVY
jgi:hypothetical protein